MSEHRPHPGPSIIPALANYGNSFDSWDAVLAHVKANRPTFYQAPLDHSAVRISARVSGKRVKVDPMSRECDPFWADSAHLDRFRRTA